MKKFLILLLYPIMGYAQTDSLLTPQQLKEDADYYFSTLLQNHPNPYYYYSKEVFDEEKNSIYARLDKPMTWKQFIWIIGEINGYVDAHSRITNVTLPAWTESSVKMIKFFPNVDIKNEKVYLKENGNEVEEINGVKVDSIVKDIKRYCNWKLPHERNWALLQNGFSYFLLNKYEMKAPFKVKFANSEKIHIVQGKSSREYYEHSSLDSDVRGGNFTSYKVYPFSSIAIFNFRNFSEPEQKTLQKELDVFFQLVEGFNIQHVFYDLTLNGGGQNSVFMETGIRALNIIEHDDIYFKLTETKRTEQGISKYQMEKAILPSNKKDSNKTNNRKLYVLQGTNTESAGDYFCRIVAENNLGFLIGQNTGEPTTAFTCAYNYTLPHSKWSMQAATALYDFSEYFDTETLHPDLYWDVNHSREFTEEELVEMVKQCETVKK